MQQRCSADETLHNGTNFRAFLEENRNNKDWAHEAFRIIIDVGSKMWSVRISRTDKGEFTFHCVRVVLCPLTPMFCAAWRYVYPVHEYLKPQEGSKPTTQIDGSYIM